ncbi:hypothetical protein GP475_08915 [Corynebacterium poyangense]|uniref:Uncharacterized protein n=1 Tax=Corynebacterium poyangense TaxID=2684405 RepID=A0A7H0SQC2_9CORY|nr:hypothetical protein [Corynebacterium poyangense]QNQ90747.1 hypothetical protein GP475_08915 [Corynebacterium poyangense]
MQAARHLKAIRRLKAEIEEAEDPEKAEKLREELQECRADYLDRHGTVQEIYLDWIAGD